MNDQVGPLLVQKKNQWRLHLHTKASKMWAKVEGTIQVLRCVNKTGQGGAMVRIYPLYE